MDRDEIRLRLIEAAAKSPMVHQDGPAAGVLKVARTWEEWVRPQSASTPSARQKPIEGGADSLF